VRPYLKKNPLQQRAGGVVQGVGPEIKLQYHERKKERKRGREEGRDGGREEGKGNFLCLLEQRWEVSCPRWACSQGNLGTR
jgi:hypothetical protein